MNKIDNPEQRVRTVGVMARELGQPIHRIQYLLRTRPHIQHFAVAGGLRCFRCEAVAQLRYEINLIDAKKTEVVK